MGNDAEKRERCLVQARALVESLESGDHENCDRILEELSAVRETDLFVELGKMTRDLHDTLNGFQIDTRISNLAEKDIPDAKERLNYVVQMTEQAANKTMDAVERCIPLAETIGRRSTDFKTAWQRFRDREMTAEEFRQLSNELDEFFEQTGGDVDTLRSNLSDVLMAQDFQDLTGQVIRRVTSMVQDVEESLVGMIRIAGKRLAQDGANGASATPQEKDNRGTGPAVPGVSDVGVVQSQDEVDDLLSSLGF